jgi:hypothetical protein
MTGVTACSSAATRDQGDNPPTNCTRRDNRSVIALSGIRWRSIPGSANFAEVPRDTEVCAGPAITRFGSGPIGGTHIVADVIQA